MKKNFNINYQDVYDLYYNQGLTYKEIGNQYGCSAHTIRKIAKRHGFVSLRGKSKHRKIIIQKSILPLSLINREPIVDNFSNRSLEVVLGGLLGDSYIKRRKNKNTVTYNIYFAQCKKQEEYLKWKYNHFLPEEKNPVRIEKRNFSIISGKKYQVQDLCAFSTKPFDFSFIYNLLIKDDKKVIDIEYLKLLTPLSLAIWYQDDGNYNEQNRIVRIATMCFNEKDHKILRNYFYDYLKMPCFLENTSYGSGLSLCLTQNSSKKFLQLIYPYMCSSMMYKNNIFRNPSETSKA